MLADHVNNFVAGENERRRVLFDERLPERRESTEMHAPIDVEPHGLERLPAVRDDEREEEREEEERDEARGTMMGEEEGVMMGEEEGTMMGEEEPMVGEEEAAMTVEQNPESIDPGAVEDMPNINAEEEAAQQEED